MRIMLYVNNHLPDIGGREMVVHNLALQFQAKGHDVVVAGAPGFREHRHLDFGYPVTRWPIIGRAPLVSRMAALAVAATRQRFDVVNAHATFPCGYVAVKLKKMLGCPIVITPHGEDINIIPELDYGQRMRPEQARKIDYAVANADATTAISETVYASLLDAGAAPQSIHRISNGVDIDRFRKPAAEGLVQRFDLPTNARIISSIGNYQPIKGHEVLVEAMARSHQQHPDLHLVIIGRTSDEFIASAKAKGYDRFVTFTGPLSVPAPGSPEPDWLAALLSASVMYASASINEGAEGLSLSLLEAMAAGACPVVTDVSGNRDVVTDGETGRVVKPQDPVALADAFSDLAADGVKLQRLRDAASTAAESFAWSAIADEYLGVFGGLGVR